MSQTKYSDLIVEKKDSIGYITINRPEKRNALTIQQGGTVQQLAEAFEEMRLDSNISVFMLQGTGDVFCAGFDMGTYDQGAYWKSAKTGWAAGRQKEPAVALATIAGDLENPGSKFPDSPMWLEGLWNNPKPSVVKVRSFCFGAGLWLINLSDIVIATPEAIFGYPPVRYGASLTPDILPPWILGLRKTMFMGLTGQSITATEALECGLITKIVPEDKIDEECQKICESISRVPPATNYYTKWIAHNYFEGLGIKQFRSLGMATVVMTEESSIPGHYWDFFENLVFKKGFTAAYKEQREKWGYPDPVMDREVARLKAKKNK